MYIMLSPKTPLKLPGKKTQEKLQPIHFEYLNDNENLIEEEYHIYSVDDFDKNELQ
jgi:hypothetical protein